MTLARPADWRPQGIEDLEPNAWIALRETGRSVCVTAGAGAGKTEFLAQKAAYLRQTGICSAPKRILAICFKRDAARNLSLRVQERCAPAQSRRFDSMTFDAFTKNLLDRFRAAGAFQTFTQDFNAKPISLLLNWRSHEALVAVQRVVAAKIDPYAVPVEARAPLIVDGDIAAIWEFDSRQAEREGLAAWLRAQVDSGSVEPHDVAILVRKRVDDAEAELF